MPVEKLLRIGEVARTTSLSPDTIRHYERLGLLAASRTPGRFREYTRDAVHRVRVIQAALAIGFSLAELARAFAERRAGRAPCRRVRRLADDKLAALDERITELTRLRAQLARTIAAWDRRLEAVAATDGTPAHLLDSLVAEPRRAR